MSFQPRVVNELQEDQPLLPGQVTKISRATENPNDENKVNQRRFLIHFLREKGRVQTALQTSNVEPEHYARWKRDDAQFNDLLKHYEEIVSDEMVANFREVLSRCVNPIEVIAAVNALQILDTRFDRPTRFMREKLIMEAQIKKVQDESQSSGGLTYSPNSQSSLPAPEPVKDPVAEFLEQSK